MIGYKRRNITCPANTMRSSVEMFTAKFDLQLDQVKACVPGRMKVLLDLQLLISFFGFNYAFLNYIVMQIFGILLFS